MNYTTHKIVTLEQFIIEKEKALPYATGEFSQLLRDLALAAKLVNFEIKRAGLVNVLGDTGTQNVHGESVQKLDVFANEQFIHALKLGEQVCVIASEENEEYIPIENTEGRYVVIIDPLDGSSNIDVNISVGTIFSIYRRVSKQGFPTPNDCLQKGNQQLAAGYILYGTSTILVYTTGNGVNGFTLDASIGEFFLSHPNIKMPNNLGGCLSINECQYDNFLPQLKNYLSDVKKRDTQSKDALSPRYVGSMIADFHRNLFRGGIFIYPGTTKTPHGKLRLLYEAKPVAFLAEQAGGIATNGFERILDIIPSQIHQLTPFFVGSTPEMKHLAKFLAQNTNPLEN